MVNDDAPALGDLQVEISPSDLWILVWAADTPVALFLLCPRGDGAAEVHVCVAPSHWGRTERIVLGFLAWVWTATNLRTLVGPVPSYNRLALKLALATGFQKRDLLAGHGIRRGKPFDLIVTAVERP